MKRSKIINYLVELLNNCQVNSEIMSNKILADTVLDNLENLGMIPPKKEIDLDYVKFTTYEWDQE